MLTLQENCKILYIVLVESTHPNPIHYNNRTAKITKVKIVFMKVKSSKVILALGFCKIVNCDAHEPLAHFVKQ